jgi:predicted methyltransferase
MRQLFATTAIIATAALVTTAAVTAMPKSAAKTKISPQLSAAIAAPNRTPGNLARDQFRNPGPTLTFFGVKPNQTVVELWPGGGWYTEILAPYMAGKGTLIVAPPAGPRADRVKTFLGTNPTAYGKVKIANFPNSEGATPVAPGTADVVLTFRNVHNWRFDGADKAQDAFNQIYAMLKPGGVLGIVEHRLPEAADIAREEKSGYMKTSSVVSYATKAGFKLAGASEVNANPKDTADWANGVWTLPPVYALKDVDRAKYAAIGESDRMTLKFVKPRK